MNDFAVSLHAVRNMARIGMGVIEHKWMELGFGRTSTTSTAQATPRNVLGFKDGTRNIKAEQTDLLNPARVGSRPVSVRLRSLGAAV